MPRTAAGIPNRDDYGDPLTDLTPGQLADWVVQRHKAERAGEHYDVRFGTPQTGLYSWASRKGLPAPGEKRLAVMQPLHAHSYKDFKGTIREGYGKGEVERHDLGQVLITKTAPDAIHFSTAHRRFPERYVLLKPKSGNNWLMLNTTKMEPTPYEKVHFKLVPQEKAENVLSNLQPGSSAQAKVDGAAALVQLYKDHFDVLSYRTQKEKGYPIVHTERVFGGRPTINIPKEHQGQTLRGELYGVKQPKAVIIKGNPKFIEGPHKEYADKFYGQLHDHIKNKGFDVEFHAGEPYTTPPPADLWVGHSRGADRLRFAAPDTKTIALGSSRPGAVNHPDDTVMGPGQEPTLAHYQFTDEMRKELDNTADQIKERPIPPHELGGLLNSSIGKSLADQQARKVRLKVMLFDILNKQTGKHQLEVPYEQRMAQTKSVGSVLPQAQFNYPEEAKTPEEAKGLLQRVATGQEPLTVEGIVIHPPMGVPQKVKLRDEHDVHIREFFPGMGKYENKGVGGFKYSHEPEGPIVGEVGTGFSDEERMKMHQDPSAYLGRVARVSAQNKKPSGALFAPSYISLHEDYPMKTAQAVLDEQPSVLASIKARQTYGNYDLNEYVKEAAGALKQLLKAKERSDVGDYRTKTDMVRKLLREKPHEFDIDSDAGHVVGLTHRPTKFRIHLPKTALPTEFVAHKRKA